MTNNNRLRRRRPRSPQRQHSNSSKNNSSSNINKYFILFCCFIVFALIIGEHLNIGLSSYQKYDDNDDYNILPILSSNNSDNKIAYEHIESGHLDFAVIGFPKCGTSTMMRFLHTNSSFVPGREICLFNWKKQKDIQRYRTLVSQFSEKYPSQKIGIKCPSTLEHFDFYDNVNTYFSDSNTRYIVGIRHPIEWFESFYNFRVNNINSGMDYPLANQLIGKTCYKTLPAPSLCTARGRVSHYLAHMGKTPLSSPEELKLISDPKLIKKKSVQNHVFLYNLDQLSDKNETRMEIFHRDLTSFVGIPFESDDSIEKKKSIPGKKWPDEEQDRRDRLKIDICDSQYKRLRQVLLEEAKKSKQWIIDYFLKNDEVSVSSRDYFEETMHRWTQDPCESRDKK